MTKSAEVSQMCHKFVVHLLGERIIARADEADKRPDAPMPRMDAAELEPDANRNRRKLLREVQQLLQDLPMLVKEIKYDIHKGMP
jgi:hypothetical protein